MSRTPIDSPKIAPADSHHATPDFRYALQQQQHIRMQIDRYLWWILPVLAFVLSMIIANWNILSTIGTLLMLLCSFVAVGIKRRSLVLVLSLSTMYCLIDNYFSYQQQLSIAGLQRQWLCSSLFIGIVGIFRPILDRHVLRQSSKI